MFNTAVTGTTVTGVGIRIATAPGVVTSSAASCGSTAGGCGVRCGSAAADGPVQQSDRFGGGYSSVLGTNQEYPMTRSTLLAAITGAALSGAAFLAVAPASAAMPYAPAGVEQASPGLVQDVQYRHRRWHRRHVVRCHWVRGRHGRLHRVCR
jgi:hypothetical protein